MAGLDLGDVVHVEQLRAALTVVGRERDDLAARVRRLRADVEQAHHGGATVMSLEHIRVVLGRTGGAS